MAIYKNIEGTPELFGNVSDGTQDLIRVTSEDYQFDPVSSGIASIEGEFIFRYDKITGMQITMYTTNPTVFNEGWNILARCRCDGNSEYAKAIRPRMGFMGNNGIGFYELFTLSGSGLFDAGAYVIPKYRHMSDYMELSMYCKNAINIPGLAHALLFNAMFFNDIR